MNCCAILRSWTRTYNQLFYNRFIMVITEQRGAYKMTEWETRRVKDFGQIRSGDGITNTMLSEDGTFEVYGGNGVMGRSDTYNLSKDAIIIGRVGALCGNVHVLHKLAFVSDNALILTCDSSVNIDFVAYSLYNANLNRLNNSSAQPLVTGTAIKRQKLAIPSLDTQRRIVSYLDSHVSSIDKRVSLLTTKRDHYLRLKTAIINRAVTQGLNPEVKMKDSGVEWIGMIPEHWEIRRMKDLSSYISRGSTPDYVDESNFAVMNQATFSKGYIDFDIVRYSSPMKKDSKLQNGDLIMASTGGGILGKVFYFENAKRDFYADTHVTIIRGSIDLFSKFAYYYFSTRYEMINALMAKGSTNQTELQRDALLQHVLPVPSLSEQREITACLDEKCAKIDAIVENLNQQIEKHKLLKRALINEVITGQRAV